MEAQASTGSQNNQNLQQQQQQRGLPPSRKEEGRLFVNSFNPFAEVTLRTRLRQLLYTHQGRDKIFKVFQYYLRLLLWARNTKNRTWYFGQRAGAGSGGQDFVLQTLNRLTDGRRMFRIGRFVAEFVKMRATLIKCSEIQFAPNEVSKTLQVQMFIDILARSIMCVKSVAEDVVFLVQNGLLNKDLEPKLLVMAAKLGLPVLIIDLYLNTMRLAQGIVDARTQQPLADAPIGSSGSVSAGTPTTVAERRLSVVVVNPNDLNGGKGDTPPASKIGRQTSLLNVGKDHPKSLHRRSRSDGDSPGGEAHNNNNPLGGHHSGSQTAFDNSTNSQNSPVVQDSTRTFSLYATYKMVDKIRAAQTTHHHQSPNPSTVAPSRSSSNLNDIIRQQRGGAGGAAHHHGPSPKSSESSRPAVIASPAPGAAGLNPIPCSPPSSRDELELPSSTETISDSGVNTPVTAEDVRMSSSARTATPPPPPEEGTRLGVAAFSPPSNKPGSKLWDSYAAKPHLRSNNASMCGHPPLDGAGGSTTPGVLSHSTSTEKLGVSPDQVPANDTYQPQMLARKSSTSPANANNTSSGSPTANNNNNNDLGDELIVDSYMQLIWTDFELHWVCVTQFKLILDLMVGAARVFEIKQGEGFLSLMGFVSGLLSVYRVWTYGR